MGKLSGKVSDESRYITGIEMPIDLGYGDQPAGIPPLAAAVLAAGHG